MSDPHDPYVTPPAPERFQPPQADTPAQAPPAADAHTAPLGPVSLEAREPWVTADVQSQPAGDEPSRLPFGEAVPALEPLPVAAGDFGNPQQAAALADATLSSRLVDEFVAWLKTLASAAVYATLIVTFGFQVARVEGQSMAPTLQNQDRLIVNKFAYLSAVGEPQVGDIVMLYYPNNPDKSFVKRVIAAENDRVRIVDGKVYRNDVLVDDSFVPEQYRSHEDWGPDVVPEGYYFVMGDHRNNSSDSRHWGFVPKKYIIGRVQLRWWPVPDARTF